MDISMIVFLCILPFFYVGVYIYMKKKKKAQTELIANTNPEEALQKADSYKENLISKKLEFLRKEMAGKPIDAINYASLPYTAADSIKDGMKNSLKSLATLGLVRYTTVITPIYLILSGENLHMIQLSPSDEIENHYVFDPIQLRQATIQKAKLTAVDKGYINREGDDLKVYELIMRINNEELILKLYTSLIFTFSNEIGGNVFKNAESFLQERTIALQFFDQLGKRYSNLNVKQLL